VRLDGFARVRWQIIHFGENLPENAINTAFQ
jgi:hypothetical protein